MKEHGLELYHFLLALLNHIGIIESLFTIAAIIAGLMWFHKKRENAPRANVEHTAKFINLKNGTVYVGVHLIIHNTGNIRIMPKITKDTTSTVIVEELMPYLKKRLESQDLSPEYKMDLLGRRSFPPEISIEPGETQALLFEFVIQRTSKVIKVYSYIGNDYNGGVGWATTTIHEVKYDQ